MRTGRAIGMAVVAGIVTFVLFEVTFPFDVASSYESKIPDANVEAEYARCYQEKDKAMHKVAFGTIDNPDVQREFISTNRELIVRECRQLFPEKLITIQESSRFNIVDLKPRFW